MKISTTEQDLRMKAVRSALASVRLAGFEPSEMAQTLFDSWAQGATSIDIVRDTLTSQSKEQHD